MKKRKLPFEFGNTCEVILRKIDKFYSKFTYIQLVLYFFAISERVVRSRFFFT